MTLPFDLPAERPRSGPERHLTPNRKLPHLMSPADRVTSESIYPAEKIAARKGQKIAVDAIADSYREDFMKAVKFLACDPETGARDPFTVEDVTALIGLPSDPGNGGNPQNNSLGGLISQCASRGLIEKIGYKPSTREGTHGRILTIWRGSDDGRGGMESRR